MQCLTNFIVSKYSSELWSQGLQTFKWVVDNGWNSPIPGSEKKALQFNFVISILSEIHALNAGPMLIHMCIRCEFFPQTHTVNSFQIFIWHTGTSNRSYIPLDSGGTMRTLILLYPTDCFSVSPKLKHLILFSVTICLKLLCKVRRAGESTT